MNITEIYLQENRKEQLLNDRNGILMTCKLDNIKIPLIGTSVDELQLVSRG